MRDTINIKGLGAIQLEAPRSFVAINDLVSEYSANQKSRAKLARLSAAAVGLCWSEKNVKAAPVYDLASGEIVAYGGDVLEWLLRQKCDLPSLYETFPEKGRPGSAGAEDSQALGA